MRFWLVIWDRWNQIKAMTKPVKWGILACGDIANTFAEALKEAEGSELQAVAARDADRAQDFAKTHGAVCAYGSYEGLLADPEVEAVYIATIHPHHLEWIQHCLQAGKHVLCEKPMTMNLREAKLAQQLAKDKSCLLREAFMYRHHPQTQRVVELVESGKIGAVRMIDAVFGFNGGDNFEGRHQAKELGGGGILDLGCYTMSFSRLIAGRARDRMFAEPLELKAVGHLHPKTQVDAWTTASLRFEGDILATNTCAVQVNQPNTVTIYGDLGNITVMSPWFCRGETIVQLDDGSDPEVFPSIEERNLYAYEIESFTGELRGTPIDVKAAAMRLDDTMGNIKALDWWRQEIGLAYEADRIG